MSSALTAFEPQNLEQMFRFSEWLAKSQLIPRALQGKPQDVTIVLLKGREVGLSPMQALGTINVIEGKAVMAAELLVALVKRHSDICEHFSLVESTETKATFSTRRKGSPKESALTYTIEQATKAGLAGKDNWKKHTATMLRWRAAAALARSEYPDLTSGIVTPDEAEEIRESKERELNPAPRQEGQSKTAEIKEALKARLAQKPALSAATEQLAPQMVGQAVAATMPTPRVPIIDVKEGQTDDEAYAASLAQSEPPDNIPLQGHVVP